jgi:mannan endo-1,4-beta-mannosidase
VAAVVVTTVVALAGSAPAEPGTAQALTRPAPRSQVLDYLTTISGRATVAGQHNREPLARPTRWTDRVHTLTGAYPGLWGGDFAFTDVEDRPDVVRAALAQWRAGALVTLMWHTCPPGRGQECDWKRDVRSRLSDAQWTELTTDGTSLNGEWKAQLDAAVPLLQQLKRQGVEVLWRPDHELNDGWAWWGGRPGPEGSSKLYRMTHDYLTGQGLTNLVWVWSVKDVGDATFAQYYPGDRYVDVVGLDAWVSEFPSVRTYAALAAVAGDKPMALTEVGTVPTPTQLAGQPRWTYFMVWAEMVTQRSSVPRLQHTYADAWVLTRDEVSVAPAPAAGSSSGAVRP